MAMGVWITSSFVTVLPGIIQLVLIPQVVRLLMKISSIARK